jgi:AcrR family transcriptional regulator
MISREGYPRVTLTSLVKVAGISKAGFYDCFDSLEQCIVETYRLAAENALTATRTACEKADDRQRLPTAVAAVLGMSAAQPDLARVLSDPALLDVPAVAAMRGEMVERFADLLTEVEETDAGRLRRRRNVELVRGAHQWLFTRLSTEVPSRLESRAWELTMFLSVSGAQNQP